MDHMFSDWIETGEWTAPAAQLVGFRPVCFGDGKLVAHATFTCQALSGEAARGR